jgi:hypothetical protein
MSIKRAQGVRAEEKYGLQKKKKKKSRGRIFNMLRDKCEGTRGDNLHCNLLF